jgi:hypothetical protein
LFSLIERLKTLRPLARLLRCASAEVFACVNVKLRLCVGRSDSVAAPPALACGKSPGESQSDRKNVKQYPFFILYTFSQIFVHASTPCKRRAAKQRFAHPAGALFMPVFPEAERRP